MLVQQQAHQLHVGGRRCFHERRGPFAERPVAGSVVVQDERPAGQPRIDAGATVEQSDLQALMPWLAWAYGQVTQSVSA